jgi:hypothetical protein
VVKLQLVAKTETAEVASSNKQETTTSDSGRIFASPLAKK